MQRLTTLLMLKGFPQVSSTQQYLFSCRCGSGEGGYPFPGLHEEVRELE